MSIVNSVWITASHVLLFEQYIATHEREAAMMRSMAPIGSGRLMMALTGPVIGVVSGIVLGLFTVVAGKVVKAPGAQPGGAAS